MHQLSPHTWLSPRFQNRSWAALTASGLLGAILLVLMRPAPMLGDDAVESKYLRWVEELADQDFLIREEASRKLVHAGLAAMDAVRKGVAHPDREIRYRSLRILRIIEDNHLRVRLASFLRGEEGEPPLHGWQEFKTLVGNTPATRDLFADMTRAEESLLRALALDAADAENILTLRTRSLETGNRYAKKNVSTGSVAALLFVAGDTRVNVPQNTASAVHRFCGDHSFALTAKADSQAAAMRMLLGRWIRRAEGWAAYRAMELARKHNLADGLVPAERIIRSPTEQTNSKAAAILTIAKLGGDAKLPLLKTLLDDPTAFTTQRIIQNNKAVQLEGQLRDAALASILHLHGQDPLEFGFSERLRRNDDNLFDINSIVFDSAEKREQAFRKWEAFQKKMGDKPAVSPEPNEETEDLKKEAKGPDSP